MAITISSPTRKRLSTPSAVRLISRSVVPESRYEVYSATLSGQLVGIIVVARDTNGDYFADTSSTYQSANRLWPAFRGCGCNGKRQPPGASLWSSRSSGYFNSSNPNDPNNEPSPGVILLVRDPNTGGFDPTRSRTLVTVGDNRLFNANALALLPNNDLLVADFTSNELRIIRDTDADGMPDTLVDDAVLFLSLL